MVCVYEHILWAVPQTAGPPESRGLALGGTPFGRSQAGSAFSTARPSPAERSSAGGFPVTGADRLCGPHVKLPGKLA